MDRCGTSVKCGTEFQDKRAVAAKRYVPFLCNRCYTREDCLAGYPARWSGLFLEHRSSVMTR